MLLILYGNVGFGASIFMIFHWRRLTAASVWACVILSVVVSVIVPFGAQLVPSLRTNPQLVQVSAGLPAGKSGGFPIYFDSVSQRKGDPAGGAQGHGRFNFELYLLKQIGLQVNRLSAGGILAAQFFFDGLFPFAVLFGVSHMTARTPSARVERFYGKMKTPVGETPEKDRQEVDETMLNPTRFDHLKLFPRSQWEFCRWTREDTFGFFACCGISGAILGSFWLILRALA
jgi:SSS family solute:Na+ symporter